MELKLFKSVSREIINKSRTLNNTIKTVNSLLSNEFVINGECHTLGEWLKEAGIVLNDKGKLSLSQFTKQFSKDGVFAYYASTPFIKIVTETAPNGAEVSTTYNVYKYVKGGYTPLKYYAVNFVRKDKWSVALLLKVIEHTIYNKEWEQKSAESFQKCINTFDTQTTYGFRDRSHILNGNPFVFAVK